MPRCCHVDAVPPPAYAQRHAPLPRMPPAIFHRRDEACRFDPPSPPTPPAPYHAAMTSIHLHKRRHVATPRRCFLLSANCSYAPATKDVARFALIRLPSRYYCRVLCYYVDEYDYVSAFTFTTPLPRRRHRPAIKTMRRSRSAARSNAARRAVTRRCRAYASAAPRALCRDIARAQRSSH